MDTQLRFIQSAPRPDAEEQPVGQKEVQFCATLNIVGVEIAVGDRIVGRVGWDRLEGETDVEYLASHFWSLRVWEFRIVLDLLVKARNAKALVETQ